MQNTENKANQCSNWLEQIKPFTVDDLPWVKELWAENKGILGPPMAPGTWLRSHADNEFFIVISNFAFAHYRKRKDGTNVLYEIAVSSKMKKMGIGKALMLYIGLPMELKTDYGNEESNSFYKKLGFICMGKKYTKSGKLVAIYRKF